LRIFSEPGRRYDAGVEADREAYVVVPNVRAVSNGLVLFCALEDGRSFGVPANRIGPESDVRVPGDNGALTVRRWFALEHEALGQEAMKD
jgi:hypothetical protein